MPPELELGADDVWQRGRPPNAQAQWAPEVVYLAKTTHATFVSPQFQPVQPRWCGGGGVVTAVAGSDHARLVWEAAQSGAGVLLAGNWFITNKTQI